MTYIEVVSYLNSFIDYERCSNFSYKKSLKLERISSFLNLIGNPHLALNCIHIAGTKGKGSTAAFVAFTLRQAGYNVGLYTSPHLNDFRERIRILKYKRFKKRQNHSAFEGSISRQSICSLVSELKPIIDKFNRMSSYGALTFFEVWTGIAFLYFYRNRTDIVVLETGLGGRLDATNVVSPLVVGISPISLEHKKLLGNTLVKIAREKVAIIKRGTVVVSAPQEKSAFRIIKTRSQRQGVSLYCVGEDIRTGKTKTDLSGSVFSLKGLEDNYANFKIRLGAGYQISNAALAIGIIESLRLYGIVVPKGAIRKGLSATIWPGRFEVINKKPLIILDGAQNKASSIVLKKAIRNTTKKKIILVFGVSNDKDLDGMLDVILPLAKKVIITKSSNPRAMNIERIRKKVLKIDDNLSVLLTDSVKEALKISRQLARGSDCILITGSLFVVAEARECLI